jgi:peptide/nickel transport system substrate-binding protein
MILLRRLRSVAFLAAALFPGIISAQTLRTAIPSDIRGLMPGNSPDVYTGTVLQNVYEGLVAWKSDGSVAPMLADRIEISPDGKTFTFTLRDGVVFHNGAPLTSKEVVWTWKRFLDPNGTWPCRANFNGSNAIKVESVEGPDDKHVVFKLQAPSGSFLSAMARSDCDSTGIAHPDSVGADGNWSQAIGTGPFMLKEWRKGQYIDLARFDGYKPRSEAADGLAGKKEALLAGVRLNIIPNSQVARAALLSGQIDVWPDIEPSQVKEIEANPAVKITTSPVASIYTLTLQTRDPVLSDPRIRRAIAYAIDRKSLSDALFEGRAIVSSSLIPATSRFYGPVEKTGTEYDPDKAQQLLKEAGYHGERIVIQTNRQNAYMSDTAIYVQSMLKAVGINADVEVLEFATQFQHYYAGTYQMSVWNLTPYLDPIYIFERFTGSKEKQADKVWDDPNAFALLRALFETTDDKERQRTIDSAHELLIKTTPLIVWGTRVSVGAFRPNVQGFQAWPGQKPRFWGVSLLN